MHDAAATEGSEIDQLTTVYLRDAGCDPHRALRLAIIDLIQVSIESRLAELELRQRVSAGYLRQRPLDRAA